MASRTDQVRPGVASASRVVRERLGYPVVDCDGHLVEFLPPLEDYVKAIGGSDFGVRFWNALTRFGEHHMSFPAWWSVPTRNTLDRCTAALPKLLYERLDDLGFDYTILFSTATGYQVYRKKRPDLRVSNVIDTAGSPDPELRRITVRALNTYRADICREFSDRMTPVAAIPMNTPEEAIEELEHSVRVLGTKVIDVVPVRRPLRDYPELYPKVFRVDNLCIDSDFDYDPFWARCVELRVPIASHGATHGFHHRSTCNFAYNTQSHFADAGDYFCKALVMGGVLHRFPDLRVAFMEGGVLTGCRLLGTLLGVWGKRNRDAIHDMDPALLDRDLFRALHARYAGPEIAAHLDDVLDVGVGIVVEPEVAGHPERVDEFARAGIERPEDIRAVFERNLFFGCEADDSGIAAAMQRRLWPLETRLNPLLGSDIGHWDVRDFTEVLGEAYELLEHGKIGEDDLAALLLGNPLRFLVDANPGFFAGTTVAAAAEHHLREHGGAATPTR
jgi:hypothetical protein